MSSHAPNGTIHSFELRDSLRFRSPLVDHEDASFSRYHNVAVLWHIQHICEHILFFVDEALVTKVVSAVTQPIHGCLVK